MLFIAINRLPANETIVGQTASRVRATRRLALSEANAELLPSVKNVFGDLDEGFDGLRQFADRRSGRFAVATSPLLAATLLPTLVASYRQRPPSIQMDLFHLPPDGIAQAVGSGQADFGVCAADADSPDHVDSVLFQDSLLLACPAQPPARHVPQSALGSACRPTAGVLRHGSGLRSLSNRDSPRPENRCIRRSRWPTWVRRQAGRGGIGVGGVALVRPAPHPRGHMVGVPMTAPVIHQHRRSGGTATPAFGALPGFRGALPSGHDVAGDRCADGQGGLKGSTRRQGARPDAAAPHARSVGRSA
jgi:DNA-binding transcriptional LysR family regulator